MADKTLKVTIKTEIQKGFGDLAKQLKDVSSSLKAAGALASSMNKMVDAFDRNNRLREGASNLNKLTDAQKAANKEIAAGVRIAQQGLSAQDRLIGSIGKLNAAKSAGSVKEQQALKAEIALLDKYIKQTGDLSILENKRNARGQFQKNPVSRQAREAVTTARPQAEDVSKKIEAKGRAKVAAIEKETKDVKSAMQKQVEALVGIGTDSNPFGKLSESDRKQISFAYKGLMQEIDNNEKALASKTREMNSSRERLAQAWAKAFVPATGLATPAIIAARTGIKAPSNSNALQNDMARDRREAELAKTFEAKNYIGKYGNSLANFQQSGNAPVGGTDFAAKYKEQLDKIHQIFNGRPLDEFINLKVGIKPELDEDEVKAQQRRMQSELETAFSSTKMKNKYGQSMLDYHNSGRPPEMVPEPESGGPPERTKFGSYGGGFGGGGGDGGSGPRREGMEAEGVSVGKLARAYTSLGHTMMELQYSTYTLFAVSGVEAITKTIDAFNRLNNEIARTATSQEGIKSGMASVFDIAAKTYTDPEQIGRTYSLLNSHAKDYGMSQDQVLSATTGIAATTALSPGDAQQKTRFNRELNEVLNTGQLKGQQARSISMENPVFYQALMQGIARERGKPEGTSMNLTEKGANVTGKEIASVVGDPKFVNQMMTMVADRARTFGDVLSVVKGRFEQYIGETKDSFGGLQSALNGLATWLGNKNNFDQLMKGLTSAGVGLAAFGTMLLAQSAGSILGAGGKALASSASKIGEIAEAPGAARAFMTSRALVQDAPRAMGAGLAAAKDGGEALLTGEMVTQRVATMDAAFAKLTPTMQKLVPIIGESSTGLAILGTTIDIAFAAVIPVGVAIALVAARFNYLLESVHGGVNIFDIVTGLFHKLWGTLNDGGNAIGFFTAPLIALIDKLLNKGVEAANNDPTIKNAHLKNQLGYDPVMNGQRYGFANVGEHYENAPVQSNMNAALTGAAEQSVSQRILIKGSLSKGLVPLGKADPGVADTDPKLMQRNPDGTVKFLPKGQLTPSGMQNFTPPVENKDKDKKDPTESIRNTIAKLNEEAGQIMSDLQNNDAWTKLNKTIADKVESFNEAMKNLPAKVAGQKPALKAAFDTAIANFKNAQIEASVKMFDTESDKDIDSANNKGHQESLSSAAKIIDQLQSKIVDNAIKAAGIINTGVTADQFRNGLDGRSPQQNNTLPDLEGSTVSEVTVAAKRVPRALVQSTNDAYNRVQNARNSPELFKNAAAQMDTIVKLQAAYTAGLGEQLELMGKATKEARTKNDQTQVGQQYFGGERVKAQAYMTYNQSFANSTGTADTSKMDPSTLKAYQDGLAQVDRQLQLTKDYQSSWLNGLKDGVSEYTAGLQDIAGNMQKVVQSTMQSTENAIATSLQKRRLDIKNLRKDLSTTLYSQAAKTIMGGTDGKGGLVGGASSLANTLSGGKFDLNKKADAQELARMNVQASNVYVNGLVQGGGAGVPGAGDSINGLNLGGLSKGGLMSGSGSMLAGFGADGGAIMNNNNPLISMGSSDLDSIPQITSPGSAGGLGSLLGSATSGITGLVKSGISGAGSALSGLGSLFAGIFHEGGVVGTTGGTSRYVDSSVFSGARRYHTGGNAGLDSLGPGEVPAILKQGEAVLTKSQQNAMSSGKSAAPTMHYSPNVTINYHSAAANGDASTADPDDIANKMKDTLDTHFNTAMMKAQLPGGMLHGKVSQPAAS